ncbi:hypothetical protein HBI56_149530 [Parastagonospora nodorum]|nr:hypothetical protein HBH53_052830 [Parastagonospora nodorum]KAH3981804.1 hypothetical protein HBH51_042280 [Parastagonospora nodorum]KAH4173823.1 hypothetical protein HBH43_083100 [Parastagonospora nodorum]KAH4210161.1 hypothetical protein HBI95_071310 [Parastagonospora nodorum]KAH4228133.1 hypothetical protein HBI06_098700 [Parastagonospora nodorum]
MVKALPEAEFLTHQANGEDEIVLVGNLSVTEKAGLIQVDKISSALQVYILKGAKAACVAGRTNVLRFLLENKFLIGVALAAGYGYRSMIELYIGHCNAIASQILVNAMSRCMLHDQTRLAFTTVQYLLQAGALVDDLVLQRCEARTSYVQRAIYKRGNIHCCITGGAMTITLIAHEAMKQLPWATLYRYVAIKMLLRIIANGKVKVPTEPMPFHAMVKDVIGWLKSPSVAQISDSLERGLWFRRREG